MKNKTKYSKLMTAILAVIFLFTSICVSAEYSYEKADHDYRLIEAIDKNGKRVNKPTAQFLVKRIVNGETVEGVLSYNGYDCNTPIPVLRCYVGDTIKFEDHSFSNSTSGKINGWDWQYYGSFGDSSELYSHNIVDKSEFYCSQPGETSFYLCVKDSTSPKKGFTDIWSENGNTQSVGKNKAYSKGVYWYFTAVKVIVEPVQKANLFVRCWDKETNSIIKEMTVDSGVIYGYEGTINTTYNIEDMNGYKFLEWNVQLPEGTVQYSDITRSVNVDLAGWVPQKYVNVYYEKDGEPKEETDDYKVDIRYVDRETKDVLSEETLYPDTESLSVELKEIDGFYNTGWKVVLPDLKEENKGVSGPVNITLSSDSPYKIIFVDCLKKKPDKPDDEKEHTPVITPSGICDGVISWTETDSHLVCVGTDENGNPIYETCFHTFTYRTVLSANADISPDTFKSGYGFEAEVKYNINTSLLSNSGGCSSWGYGRTPKMSVLQPSKSTVYIPWIASNRLGTQSRSIEMEKRAGNRFILPESNISEIGARKIYTPVELPGTEEAPASHSFEIYLSGGGVGDIEFCKKLNCSITINGDMYSDDFSGADN